MMLMNVKEVFDHVCRNCLLYTIQDRGTDRDFMQ